MGFLVMILFFLVWEAFSIRIKRVFPAPDSLIMSNHFREITVPLSDIRSVRNQEIA